jgi:prepilin-type N-terminal cleavage/methylation domain-containing protein
MSPARPVWWRRRNRAPGFTLLELLLVLAVLVAVAALAAPAFYGPLENFRLRKGADVVRVQLAKARSAAMRSGRTMVFRFQMSQPLFETQPWYSEEDFLESSDLFGLAEPSSGVVPLPGQSAGAAPSAPAQAGAMTSDSRPVQGTLPENVYFAGLESLVTIRDASMRQVMENQAQADWSPPILFYPDGTSSTVRVILGNSRQQFIIVKLRGLSGVAEITDLMTAAELPQ